MQTLPTYLMCVYIKQYIYCLFSVVFLLQRRELLFPEILRYHFVSQPVGCTFSTSWFGSSGILLGSLSYRDHCLFCFRFQKNSQLETKMQRWTKIIKIFLAIRGFFTCFRCLYLFLPILCMSTASTM